MGSDQKKLGFIGIVIEDRETAVPQVNQILYAFADSILARTGIPHAKDNASVITLVVDITADRLGALTGQLGMVKGVSVKSGLTRN